MFNNEKTPLTAEKLARQVSSCVASKPTRRSAMVALLAALLGTSPLAAFAEAAFPNRTIKLVVPYAAGGGTDAFARLLAQALGKQVGQTVIVDNRPGAGGLLAGGVVAQSAPDGYTLLIDQSSIATQPILYPGAAFDVRRDVTPVILGATLNNVMLVAPNFPVNTVQELITLVKANPGKFNYASTGNGTPQHLAMEIFMDKTGLKVQHVPYKGGSPGITATSTGEVQMFFISESTALPFIKSGRVRAVANGGKSRSALLPELPTFSESGMPDFQATGWLGVFAPANTPAPVVKQLNRAMELAMQDAAFKEAAAKQGFAVAGGEPQALSQRLKADLEEYGALIRKTGITVN